MSTTATVSSAATLSPTGVLEELAHLVVEVAVSYKGCPHEGLVGVFGGLLLAGLVEGGQVARRSWRAHGEGAARGGGALAS